MALPIELLSTDFDGTLFAEFDNPHVPLELQELIGELQGQGVQWVINTGREMASLMEAMARAGMTIRPDYLILVEREIYIHNQSSYQALGDWNARCTEAHDKLFTRIRQDLPQLVDWVNRRFKATLYEDAYSPFCLIAGSPDDAKAIHDYLDEYAKAIPELTIVRNDVYARFSHVGYNKGIALRELSNQLKIVKEKICVAGDHLNDLSMLNREVAAYILAPGNAVPEVKALVQREGGIQSRKLCGNGILEGLKSILKRN
jgi:HAD superfamily hydrolase (TIGR01484 family)